MTDVMTNVKSSFPAKLVPFTQDTRGQKFLFRTQGWKFFFFLTMSALFTLVVKAILYSDHQGWLLQHKPAQACLFIHWDSTCMMGLALTGWETTKRCRKSLGFQVAWACWEKKSSNQALSMIALSSLTLSCVVPKRKKLICLFFHLYNV